MRLCKRVTGVTIIVFLVLAGGIVAGCEGPAGPQGPQGAQGEKGDEGEQGREGPGARIINLSLGGQVIESGLEPAATVPSPAADTSAYFWAAIMDTTLKQVAVADTEFVLVYANLPEVGFTQLPINASYQAQRLTGLTNQPDNYNYGSGSFFLAPSYSTPVTFFGDSSTEVWGTLFGPDEGYVTLTFAGDKSELSVRTVVNSGVGLNPDTPYGQELRAGDGTRFPLDSDLSTPEREDFITTDGSGEFLYGESSTQLGALKDSLGEDLDLAMANLGLFPSGNYTDYTGAGLQLNPVERNVQMVSQWSADSIRVTAYMEGINYGNDPTAYVTPFPLDIKVVIIGGSIIGKAGITDGNVPYSKIHSLSN